MKFAVFICLLFSLYSCGPRHVTTKTIPADSSIHLKLELITDGLSAPVGMAVAGDGSNRLFVIEQKGIVRIIKDGRLMPQPFLDISTLVDHGSESYSEMGLLGIAFHPKYKQNGKFYLYYSAPANSASMDHISIVGEFRVSASDPNRADTAQRIVMRIPQPESNHNGGQLAFGPDGFLYIGLGDGGGGGDKHGPIGNGQNRDTWLGKILRIDINTAPEYAIPGDNPFSRSGGKPEIWAWGLRNPWRFSFDRENGQLFCGDVGQNEFEEIDIIEKGKNYGWRIMEAGHCYENDNCDTGDMVLPISEYSHAEGNSVTGGYVYRGKKYPQMQGRYVFGDWSGKIFILSREELSWVRSRLEPSDKKEYNVNSFGEDEAGELYLLGQLNTGPSKPGVVMKMRFE